MVTSLNGFKKGKVKLFSQNIVVKGKRVFQGSSDLNSKNFSSWSKIFQFEYLNCSNIVKI